MADENKQEQPKTEPHGIREGEPHPEAQDDSEEGRVPSSGPYKESDDHTPDPIAMTATLETSGTGGGHHERLTGTTRIFGDVERVAREVSAVIDERAAAIRDEVRGLLLQHGAESQAAQIPQQSVEQHGAPTHQGNIIAPHDDTGAGQDAPRSANVAGSPDDVSTEVTQTQKSPGDSYQQTVIAGSGSPQASAEDGDGKDFEQAVKEYGDRFEEALKGKAPAAKKTTSRRQTGPGGGSTTKK
jgi:hypothetical protein